MTRAAQRLIVAGYETVEAGRPSAGTISSISGLAELLRKAPAPLGGEGQYCDTAKAFAPMTAARRLWLARAWLCLAGSPTGGARVRRPSAQPFAHRRRRRRRTRTGHRGTARARSCCRCCPISLRSDAVRSESLSRLARRRACRAARTALAAKVWRRSARPTSPHCSAPAPAAKSRWPACCDGQAMRMCPSAAALTGCR